MVFKNGYFTGRKEYLRAHFADAKAYCLMNEVPLAMMVTRRIHA